ncbi:MAG: tetratricopeptide repeat protein [Gammaproteobacteria bacterium]|nr:tetratricopeptide repeat protein [Gammaproteobacteria bacterium]
MEDIIVDVSAQNSQQVLIDESMTRPVVVDIWSERNEPSKQLSSLLQKLATEYAGQFLLARLNADTEQMLAAQLGVRSLPTVMVLKDGQPVDGFAGAQSEEQIREWLSSFLPSPLDLKLQQAKLLVAEGKDDEALPILRQIYNESSARADIAKTLSVVLLRKNRSAEVEAILSKIKLVDQDSEYQQLKAQLELQLQAADSPAIKALQQALKDNPGDLDSAYQLAVQYSQENRDQEALELLLNLLRNDLGFEKGAAKQAYLDILKAMDAGDPLAAQYQRKLMTLLF